MTSHFNLENDISNALRMDAPLTKGPQMRWQRKLNDSSKVNISRNDSMLNASLNNTTSKTPMKTANRSMNTSNKTPTSRAPGTAKTPLASRTPGGNKTPGGRKTPGAADRFIPNRGATDFDKGHHLLTSAGPDEDEATMSPSKRDFQRAMSENLNEGPVDGKIMAFKRKAPNAPEGYQNNLKVLYSQGKTPGSCKKSVRQIPQVPERILDAPEILDDYYLNLLDWSATNLLAVCLGGHVYLWNATTGDIQQLFEMENPEDYVSSVAWIKEGNHLAVGTSAAEVQLWDVERQKRVRSMRGHVARVGAMSWNSYVLSSGSRSGSIHHHDVRVADHLVGQLAGHSQEVCGLKWSPDGRYLASGGNDNILNIWPTQVGQCLTDTSPLYTFSQHQAAVKALSWCPWQSSILASGGGTADRHIRLWNANTGVNLANIDTKSQVCSILWSKEYKELISGHGYQHNQLIIWKYPSMTRVAELTGHTQRVLHLAMSPDGSTVVSAAADETLRLWKCFQVDQQKKKAAPKPASHTFGSLRQSLR